MKCLQLEMMLSMTLRALNNAIHPTAMLFHGLTLLEIEVIVICICNIILKMNELLYVIIVNIIKITTYNIYTMIK